MSAQQDRAVHDDSGPTPLGSSFTAEAYLSEHLPALLQLLQGSDVRELELQEGDVQVRLHRARMSGSEMIEEALPELEEMPGPVTSEIWAPIVGTFYRAGQPGMPPLVSEGSRVEPATVVGIIETLHELTNVEAGSRGTVTRVLATDGQPVEYGQALFEVTGDELGTEV